MASKTLPRALRLSTRVAVPRRTFVTAVRARPSAATASAARSAVVVPVRGVKTIDFAGTKEKVYGESPHCKQI
jgi:ketol-acid reductoisomerase